MNLLERAVENRTVQIVAGIAGLIIMCISIGFWVASKTPVKPIITTRPEGYNVPILRVLPGTVVRSSAASVMLSPPTSEKRTARR